MSQRKISVLKYFLKNTQIKKPSNKEKKSIFCFINAQLLLNLPPKVWLPKLLSPALLCECFVALSSSLQAYELCFKMA
jgi:hypothetical protein